MALPELPAENEDPWFVKRNAFDQAVKSELEGRLSEEQLSATIAAETASLPGDGRTVNLVPRSAGQYGVNLADTSANAGIPFRIEHRGVGNGLDISNRPGSGHAVVVHQYDDGTAVRLDNTDEGVMLLIAQTNNPLLNPDSVAGTSATGDAIRQVNHLGASWARLTGRGSWIMTPPADATTPTLQVLTAAGSTQRGLKIDQLGDAIGLEVNLAAAAATKWAGVFAGKQYGLSATIDTSGGQVASFRRSNTTGGGSGVVIRDDSASGIPLVIQQGATNVAYVNRTGEYENLVNGGGVLMRSPDGTRYRVRVANGGTIEVVAAP